MNISGPKVLMCPPTYFSIRYEINPWMNVRNPADPKIAVHQWTRLKKALERHKVEVELAPPSRFQPDMVFTANAGIVSGYTFIPSNFRFAQRQGERSVFIDYFRKRNFRVLELEPTLPFEGEGDILPFGDTLLGGYGYRTDPKAYDMIGRLLGRKITTVQLTDPHFYHFDTCFAPLDERTAIYFPGAFSYASRAVLKNLVPTAIAVTEAEAFQMSCNAFAVGRTVFMNRASPRLRRILKKYDFEVDEMPTSEFIKSGGSVKCMILKL